MYFAYILQSEKNGQFYIGHAEDIDKRLHRHNSGQVKATKSKRPWKVVYIETFLTKLEANRRELEIKSKKSRKYIEKLILDGVSGTCFISKYIAKYPKGVSTDQSSIAMQKADFKAILLICSEEVK